MLRPIEAVDVDSTDESLKYVRDSSLSVRTPRRCTHIALRDSIEPQE
ncbi:MAG: hypothetical protein WDN66_04315 [Candidatus Saccharibacteria bacterium]